MGLNFTNFLELHVLCEAAPGGGSSRKSLGAMAPGTRENKGGLGVILLISE